MVYHDMIIAKKSYIIKALQAGPGCACIIEFLVLNHGPYCIIMYIFCQTGNFLKISPWQMSGTKP